MIRKIIKKRALKDKGDDLSYWLSKSPEERIETLEMLRKQFNGNTARLQRTIGIIQQT